VRALDARQAGGTGRPGGLAHLVERRQTLYLVHRLM
jgi:hypothetical protein